MSIKRTPSLRHLDFKGALRGLASSVQDVMLSWHNVQTASLGTSSQATLPRVRNSLAPLTKSLEIHWNDILAFLQKCHNFSEDAITWRKSFGDGDSFSLLEELTAYSDEICLLCEALVGQSDPAIECLSSLTPQLSDLLRGLRYAPAPATAAFLGVTSPDGLAAIASTNVALTDIRASLCMLYQFWTATSEACRSLLKSHENITRDHAQKLGDTWQDCKGSITSSLDAVAIEPAAPPAFRRQQRRRGSSKSEASVASLPRSSPRRMSSLDDDGVPQACWGFGMFSFGERKRR
ncbi:hypothetical protein B0H13DRAFT_2001547 [Mycena leptocephala]|nr:hypothetical protein B0H13DRAFT_2001547 [Mycena leptocephala]